jgi:hypothetical protein
MANNGDFNTPILNDTEYNTSRDAYINNQTAGTLVFENTDGSERVQLTHRSGANIKFDNRSFSFFSPNTYQGLVHGKSYTTVENDSYETVRGRTEKRTHGNFNIVTGGEGLFSDTLATQWVDTYRDIAVLKNTPELKIGGVANNSGVQHETSGTPDSKSGAVGGGNYAVNDNAKNVQKITQEKTAKLTEIERLMGKGGNINILSGKNLLLAAGTKAVDYDSGVMFENGKPITKQYNVNSPGFAKGGGQSEVKTATSVYQATDTSGAVPFGDIQIKPAGKLVLTGGSGGVHMSTAGEAKINSTGRLALGGAEVAIGGNAGKSGGGRVTIKAAMDVFIKSDVITSITAPNIVFAASSQVLLDTPNVHITKDTYIDGNTHIHGNLTVNGNVHVDGTLHVVKNITTDANVIAAGGIAANGTYQGTGISAAGTIKSRVDVFAQSVSLYSHTHGGVRGGSSNTSRPN